MSDAVLIVDEIATDRQELARALEAEGFTVLEADSASNAVRCIWESQFLVVFIASLSEKNSRHLANELRQMAPEIETIIHSKNEGRSRLVRKAQDIRDGVIAA